MCRGRATRCLLAKLFALALQKLLVSISRLWSDSNDNLGAGHDNVGPAPSAIALGWRRLKRFPIEDRRAIAIVVGAGEKVHFGLPDNFEILDQESLIQNRVDQGVSQIWNPRKGRESLQQNAFVVSRDEVFLRARIAPP